VRTGPFSDPTIVTLINRYFIPVHVNNVDGSGARYGFEPGHENAYILFETPELAGAARPETYVLGRLSQVLNETNARAEIGRFLQAHPELHQAWPELKQLEGATDEASSLRRAELLLEEGAADQALAALGTLESPRAMLLRGRALRLKQQWKESAAALARAGKSAEDEMERVRLAFDQQQDANAARLLDRFLADHAASSQAPEAYFLRGWLYHRAAQDEKSIQTWQAGLKKHPPSAALFSQKAHLTMIRMNWDLPDSVDQAR
jgi:hypothetical protein